MTPCFTTPGKTINVTLPPSKLTYMDREVDIVIHGHAIWRLLKMVCNSDETLQKLHYLANLSVRWSSNLDISLLP